MNFMVISEDNSKFEIQECIKRAVCQAKVMVGTYCLSWRYKQITYRKVAEKISGS